MKKTWSKDAISLVEAYRNRERSPVEETKAVFETIRSSDLNAFSFLDEEGSSIKESRQDFKISQ